MRWIAGIVLVIVATSASRGLAQQERGISVTGYGEVKTEPDIAKVSLGIFIFQKDLLAAKRDVDKKIADILAMLKKMEIKSEDITTTSLNVNPKYNKGGDSVVFEGYEITRSMTVTLRKISSLNELLEQSIGAGVNRIERIELATSKEEDLKNQVVGLAITDAKQVADRIATGFGAKLGTVLYVSLKSGGGDVRFNVLSEPVFPEAKYQPGLIAVTAEIEAVFSLQD